MRKGLGNDFLLGVQHLFAMFGATILVPLITGMNPGNSIGFRRVWYTDFSFMHQV